MFYGCQMGQVTHMGEIGLAPTSMLEHESDASIACWFSTCIPIYLSSRANINGCSGVKLGTTEVAIPIVSRFV